ncbi:MAG: TetR family transcriptional regulator [Chloroflexi bacterium]|nr:MAG: TetR family transcriptional regulator [Chloroflexota bacterium]
MLRGRDHGQPAQRRLPGSARSAPGRAAGGCARSGPEQPGGRYRGGAPPSSCAGRATPPRRARCLFERDVGGAAGHRGDVRGPGRAGRGLDARQGARSGHRRGVPGDGGAGVTELGLRERKKLRTREAIQREATRLFLEQGYDATTIEQIAAAVEISPSTFFNYFPSKEDVVFWDRYDPILASLITSGPPGETLSESVFRAMDQLSGAIDQERDLLLARIRLLLEVPDLKARAWGEMERSRDFLTGIFAAKTGRDPSDFELRVAAMVILVACFEAVFEWVAGDGTGRLMDLVTRALLSSRRSISSVAAPKPTTTTASIAQSPFQ